LKRSQIKIFDNATAGCGFVAFDHLYQTDKPRGANAGVLTKPLAPVKVTLDGAVQKLIPFASFENPVDMVAKRGWVGTGAFANPTATSWQGTAGTDANAARVGDKAISTCEIAGPGNPVRSPGRHAHVAAFQGDRHLLQLPDARGGAGKNVGLRIMDTLGHVLLTYNPSSCGPSFIQNDDDWTHIDISALNTATIRAQLFDEEATGCASSAPTTVPVGQNAWNPSGNARTAARSC
jgi:hypothetical protein